MLFLIAMLYDCHASRPMLLVGWGHDTHYIELNGHIRTCKFQSAAKKLFKPIEFDGGPVSHITLDWRS